MRNLGNILKSPKKIILFAVCTLLIIAVITTLCMKFISHAFTQEEIGLSRGVSIALANAGYEEEDITDLKASYSNKALSTVYKIKFSTGDYKFSYTIDSYTGEILQIDRTPISGSDYSDKEQTSASSVSDSSTQYIDVDKAKSIALSDAGLDAAAVTFIKAKRERDDGMYIYEIEFLYELNEYEYEINAADGRIIDKSVEYAD